MSKHVKVKPLEWREVFIGLKRAITDIGPYEVYRFKDHDDWRMYPAGKIASDSTSYPSFEAAQTAAQADYERRILSSLEPSPAFEAMVKALEVAKRGLAENGYSYDHPESPLYVVCAALASVKGEQA